MLLPVGKEEGRQKKYTARGEDRGAAQLDACTCLQQEVATGVGTAVGCRAGTEQRQRRKKKGISQGLVCKFRNLQGPFGKNKFNYCSRAQT
jgi:hypothetical protein